MRKILVAAFVVVGVVSVAGTVMSQGNRVNEDFRPADPGPAEPVVNREAQNKSRLSEMIHQMKGVLTQAIAEMREPAAKDVELMKALDKYLAADKLSAIIPQLEDIIKTFPGTEEARQAEIAIQALKAPVAPTPATYDPNPALPFKAVVPGTVLPLY